MAGRFTRTDALLLLMVLIWGANYSIVKSAFAEIDPQAFNAVRMMLATLLFLAVMGIARTRQPGQGGHGVFYTPAPFTRRDWWTLAWLGAVGHFGYQVLFIGGLARTSVANCSLIIATSPVVIAVGSAAIEKNADRPCLLDRRGSLVCRHLPGRRARGGASVRRLTRRSDDIRCGLLLGDLHDRRANHLSSVTRRSA